MRIYFLIFVPVLYLHDFRLPYFFVSRYLPYYVLLYYVLSRDNRNIFVVSKYTHCLKSSFFVQKFNFDFPWKLSIFWVKNSWKCCGFGLFSCWQLWFHEKNCQKKIWWKARWGFVEIEFLDKNLTFPIVWLGGRLLMGFFRNCKTNQFVIQTGSTT